LIVCALRIDFGQWSSAGVKAVNQDASAARIPQGADLDTKGIAIAIADGIGSSSVSDIASRTAVDASVNEYFSTSAAWSVKHALSKVVNATNGWLHARTDNSWARYDKDRGYVCTLTALVLKGRTAHCVHVGDTRAYRYSQAGLELLTRDHHAPGAEEKASLARAMGVHYAVELDYETRSFDVGDWFVLTSDGVHEYVSDASLAAHLTDEHRCEDIAYQLCQTALENGSNDNVTAQVARIEQAPDQEPDEWMRDGRTLPLPPELHPGDHLDEFRLVREIHRSHRSSAFLAQHLHDTQYAVIKVPSTEMADAPRAMERFIAEEWIAARVSSPFVLKPFPRTLKPQYLYSAFEYIDGLSLRQWMRDHPRASLAQIREIIAQIGYGLRALHRQEMLHQDLRPENVMIDAHGAVKIIDFGAVEVRGVAENHPYRTREILGTQQYSAPEYFLGSPGSERSDAYSLGVIAYEMLTGDLPYGPAAAQVRQAADLGKLRYQPLQRKRRDCPEWLNPVLATACHPRRDQRYGDVSEFIHALYHGDDVSAPATRQPWLERDPVTFWQAVSAVLVLVILLQWGLR
jgi:serine/threonine protein phosphatase PrpC